MGVADMLFLFCLSLQRHAFSKTSTAFVPTHLLTITLISCAVVVATVCAIPCSIACHSFISASDFTQDPLQKARACILRRGQQRSM
jgi:hypothetical protein